MSKKILVLKRKEIIEDYVFGDFYGDLENWYCPISFNPKIIDIVPEPWQTYKFSDYPIFKEVFEEVIKRSREYTHSSWDSWRTLNLYVCNVRILYERNEFTVYGGPKEPEYNDDGTVWGQFWFYDD